MFRRLRARLKYRHFERDLARELDVHRAMKQDELKSEGVADVELQAKAARELGNVTLIREDSRSIWIARWFDRTCQDVRYVARQLRRSPSFSVGLTLVLALGLASTTVVFSGMNATLLREWPVDSADRLILIQTEPGVTGEYTPLSLAEARYLRQHATTVAPLAMYVRGGAVFNDSAIDVQSNAVSATYFTALNVQARLGRLLTEDDEKVGAPAVGLISHRLWRDSFESAPDVVGRTVRIMNTPLTIVGVVEPGFEDVHRLRIDLWVPIGAAQATIPPHLRAQHELNHPVSVVARLVDRASIGAAAAELEVISRQFRTANRLPAVGLTVTDTRPVSQPASRRDVRQFLILFPILGLVLLLVCANVGGFILARTLSRQRELALRLALGASRNRVIQQVFTEVLLLAGGAGALGVVAALLMPRLLGDRIRAEHFAPDGTVYGVALLLTLVGALAAAASAMLRVRGMTGDALGARTKSAARTGMRSRSMLVATQLAVSTVLLAGAGLMTRAITHASGADPGFRVDGVDLIELATRSDLSLSQRVALPQEWRLAVNALGIDHVAFASHRPLTRTLAQTQVRLSADHPSTRRMIGHRSVSSSYFSVMGIAISEGRTLSDVSSARETVVSDKAARWLWPSASALGQQLVVKSSDDEAVYTVVGIARDVSTMSIGESDSMLYTGCGPCEVVIARGLGPAEIVKLSTAAATIDPSARIEHQTLRQNLAEAGTADLQDASEAAWLVGLSALALALIGTFGMLAYTVEERRREIGIRMALGGEAWRVAFGVMTSANRPAFSGIVVGLLVSAAAATVARHAVFGLAPLDPIAYGIALLVLLPTLALATALPARRVTRINPAITLRND